MSAAPVSGPSGSAGVQARMVHSIRADLAATVGTGSSVARRESALPVVRRSAGEDHETVGVKGRNGPSVAAPPVSGRSGRTAVPKVAVPPVSGRSGRTGVPRATAPPATDTSGAVLPEETVAAGASGVRRTTAAAAPHGVRGVPLEPGKSVAHRCL